MTFNPLAAKSVYECLGYINEANPIALDIGSQTCKINNKFLVYLAKVNKINSSKILNNFLDLEKKISFSTRDYFSAIGYYDYQSIDINGAYDSYEFDLNLNIVDTYDFQKKYDLVINNGTGEHVFNQANLYINMHNLTKKNGLMLNILPFIDWINHGFYNYNPIFFGDLAASNNYEILKLTMANRDGTELIFPREHMNVFYEQIKRGRLDSEFRGIIEKVKKDIGENILLVVILKKLSDDGFNTPLQGKYLSDIQDKKTEYNLQKIGSGSSKGQFADNVKRDKK